MEHRILEHRDRQSLHTNRGVEKALTFTLPTNPLSTTEFRFYNVEGGLLRVTAGLAGTMISSEGKGLSSVDLESQGSRLLIVGDGHDWLVSVIGANKPVIEKTTS